MRISAVLAVLVLATICSATAPADTGTAPADTGSAGTAPADTGSAGTAPADTGTAPADTGSSGTAPTDNGSAGSSGTGSGGAATGGIPPSPVAPRCSVKAIREYCKKHNLKQTYSAGVSACLKDEAFDTREKKACCVVGIWKGWVAEYKKGVLATPGCTADAGVGQYIFNVLDNRVAMVDTRVKKAGYNCDKGEDQKIELAAEKSVVNLEKTAAGEDDDVQMDQLCKGTCKMVINSCGKKLGCGPNTVDVSALCPKTCKGVKPQESTGSAPSPGDGKLEDMVAFMNKHVTELQAVEGEEEVSRTTDITIGICIGVTIGLVLYLASKLWNNCAAEKTPAVKYSEIETQEAATILSVDQPVYQTN